MTFNNNINCDLNLIELLNRNMIEIWEQRIHKQKEKHIIVLRSSVRNSKQIIL